MGNGVVTVALFLACDRLSQTRRVPFGTILRDVRAAARGAEDRNLVALRIACNDLAMLVQEDAAQLEDDLMKESEEFLKGI